jgi:hypothetical protein
MCTSMQLHVLSVKKYILLWMLTVLAPHGIYPFWPHITLLFPWLLVILDGPAITYASIFGFRIIGEGYITAPFMIVTFLVTIPSFLANIFLWRLDRGLIHSDSLTWTAWMTPFALVLVIGAYTLVTILPFPIVASLQHLTFRKIYRNSNHSS